jgi:putative DNA primase/helicase
MTSKAANPEHNGHPTAVGVVLHRLKGVTRAGNGWMALCPAHADTNPSLHVSVADNGKILVFCHAGCATESVLQALDLEMSVLASPGELPFDRTKVQSGRDAKGWADLKDAAKFCAKKAGGSVEAIYKYPDITGAVQFVVVRIKLPDDKTFRPLKLVDDRWHVGDPPRLLPLYKLPELATEQVVLVVEGEKCADLALSLGIAATTSAHGAKSAKKTDWTRLKGKKVVIAPDNNEPGRQYANDVATILRVIDSDARVFLLDLPGLAAGQDVVDWHAKRKSNGLTDEQISTELAELIQDAKPVPDSSFAYSTYSTGGVGAQAAWPEPSPIGKPPVPPPFPIEAAFPPSCERLKEFVKAVAISFQVPVDLPVFLVLAAFGLASSRRVEVSPQADWREIVAVYVLVLLPSGERKSAVFSKLIKPIRDWQRNQAIVMAAEIASLDNEIKVTKEKLNRRRAEAARGDQSQAGDSMDDLVVQIAELEGKKPKPPSLVATESTTEAIADLLLDNKERGMLAAAEGDALDVMLGRYSQGKPNFGLWLSGHAGDAFEVRRKGRPISSLDRPTLTVALAIQPEAAVELLSSKAAAGRGVLGRFFFSCPASKVGYRDLQPPPVPIQLNDWYGGRLQQLLDKEVPADPIFLTLSDEAAEMFLVLRAEIEAGLRPEGAFADCQSWGSKLAGAVARIAGILHGIANPDLTTCVIDADTLRAALAWVPYLEAHERYVAWVAGDNSTSALAERILAWIVRKSVTDFSHNDCFNAVRTSIVNEAKAIDPALDLLEELHWIRVMTEPARPSQRGRPRGSRYQVNPAALQRTSRPSPQNTQNTQKPTPGGAAEAQEGQP